MTDTICTLGLWHLGSVLSAHFAKIGLNVIGYDPDRQLIRKLKKGQAPLFEPGLSALLDAGLQSGRLSFTSDLRSAVHGASLLWITFDTPVQWDDRADIGFLRKQMTALAEVIPPDCSIAISSQVPVGFCREFERRLRARHPESDIALCYSPENLRLGKALELLENPDRIVAGIRKPEDRKRFAPILSRLSPKIIWMGLESAEMTKHAINAFLATSVVFANELAVLCEAEGANAHEVTEGLLSESRIGPRAYLRPGGAFAGGTLARDVQFLIGLEKRHRIPSLLMDAVLKSNQRHQHWIRHKIAARFKSIKGRTVSVLGLTYKANTDTLRRSWVLDLCRWLRTRGARVQAFDPVVKRLPEPWASAVSLKRSVPDAFAGADCAVIATDHALFRQIDPEAIQSMAEPFILDPNGVLNAVARRMAGAVDYRSVGFEFKRESNGDA